MSTGLKEPPATSFAETALRLGGKSETEARTTGALDRADDEVEAMFAQRYQTTSSPIHRLIWDAECPVDQFAAHIEKPTESHERCMKQSIDLVRKHKQAKTLFDARGKIAENVFKELGEVGYWGTLVSHENGGLGMPLSVFGPFLTKMATVDATVAGLASVHGCIGAVDPVRTFGNAEQKKRFLPVLASGERLSAFALTEPCAGSDLTALRTTARLDGDSYILDGEKLFITNALPGRMIGCVCLIDNKPAVLIVDLPKEENEQFQLKTYGLYALRRTNNNGLVFKGLRVPKENLLKVSKGDGLTIAYHGLNLGRVALCAGAAGSMRVMLANMLPWSKFRKTYGETIATRELVRRRIGRLASLIVGADAMVAWCAGLLDQGYRGEMECTIAKIYGSEAQKEAAIELFMKTHGGRSFLHGHLFGDEVHEFLAPCIYEGEGEVLGMAFFKSLVKQHGKEFFEPIGKTMQAAGLKNPNPLNPLHAWKLRSAMVPYGKWLAKQTLAGWSRPTMPTMPKAMADHAEYAVSTLQKSRLEVSAVMRKHQLKLADRQCRMAELSIRTQERVTMLVASLHASRKNDEVTLMAADILCQDITNRLEGRRPSDSYFRTINKLGQAIIEGGFRELAGIEPADILMPYENR